MSNRRLIRVIAFVLALALALAVVETALAGYNTIPYGEQSDDVRVLQSALKKKGCYKGSIDGKFGPGTKKAVMKYQRSVGLHADGRPGNKTLTALYEGGSSAINTADNRDRNKAATPQNPRTLYYGCSGTRVRALQRALKKAGCFSGAIDGEYGDMTYEAVKRYQSKVGLHSDGMAGTKTIASLKKKTKVNISASFVLDVGSKGSEVTKLQKYLEENGYLSLGDYTGSIYGETTAEAVAAMNGDGTRYVTESQYNSIVLAPKSADNSEDDGSI